MRKLCVLLACLAMTATTFAADPGDVVIIEIMYNPNGTENPDISDPNCGAQTGWGLPEWIEIYNPSEANTVVMTDWYFWDEDNVTHGISAVPWSMTLGPQEVGIVFTGYPDVTDAEILDAWENVLNENFTFTRARRSGAGGDCANWASYFQFVGRGLSNSPSDTSEILELRDDSSTIIDEVNYDDYDPWPLDDPPGNSIYLKAAAFSDPNGPHVANDDGSNWLASSPCVDQAFTNFITEHFDGTDVGSPGRTPLDTGDIPPTATSIVTPTGLELRTLKINLDGESCAGGSLTFIITQIPSTDDVKVYDGLGPPNSDPQITAVEYNMDTRTLITAKGEPGVTGVFDIKYVSEDSLSIRSPEATIEVAVQDEVVVITEIMYNPTGAEPENEYVEVFNLGLGAGIATLNELSDIIGETSGSTANNLRDTPLGPNTALIIAMGAGVEPPYIRQEFLDDWGLQASQVLFVEPDAWPPLNNGGDRIRLYTSAPARSSNPLYDQVDFKIVSPWPPPTGAASIYVSPAGDPRDWIHPFKDNDSTEPPTFLGGNDRGGNWSNSLGTSEDGAIVSISGSTGSPGFVPGLGDQNIRPWAEDIDVHTLVGTDKDIALPGDDPDSSPDPNPEWTILTLPCLGTLTDLGNGQPITFPGWPLVNNGNDVRYTPMAPGIDQFKFRIGDGQDFSGIATATIYNQAGEGLVITEIMYNPLPWSDAGLEWVEVYNASACMIELGSLLDDDTRSFQQIYDDPWGNLNNTPILPGQAMVIAVSDPNALSEAEFLDEWTTATETLDPDDVLFVDVTLWEGLGNGGDRVLLYDALGRLQDTVLFDNVSPWPDVTVVNPNGGPSIAVKPGYLDVMNNDVGGRWEASDDGDNGAYTSDNGSQGSPSTVPGQSSFPPDGTKDLRPGGMTIVPDGDKYDVEFTVDALKYSLDANGPVNLPVRLEILYPCSQTVWAEQSAGIHTLTLTYPDPCIQSAPNCTGGCLDEYFDVTTPVEGLCNYGGNDNCICIYNVAMPTFEDVSIPMGAMVRLTIDPNGDISEVCEDNNVIETVMPGLDLEMSDVTVVEHGRGAYDITAEITTVKGFSIEDLINQMLEVELVVADSNGDPISTHRFEPSHYMTLTYPDDCCESAPACDGECLDELMNKGDDYVVVTGICGSDPNSGETIGCGCTYTFNLYPFEDITVPDGGSVTLTIDPDGYTAEIDEGNNSMMVEVGQVGPCGPPPACDFFDHNGDGDIDLGDFIGFQGCYSGPGNTYPPGDPCLCHDFNEDLDVDLGDFIAFQGWYTGPGGPCP